MPDGPPRLGTDERLRPTDRLKRSVEFDLVFRRGKCYRSPHLRIHFLRTGRKTCRVGLVVSRRSGNAVARARIRRLLREVFRRNRARIRVTLDIVLVAQGPPRTHEEYVTVFRSFAAWVGKQTKDGATR